jgi:hypothetical protein
VNEKKTVIIYFENGLRHDLLSFDVDGVHLEASQITTFLSMHTDNHLNWSYNTGLLCNKLNRSVIALRVLKNYMDRSALITVYYALF